MTGADQRKAASTGSGQPDARARAFAMFAGVVGLLLLYLLSRQNYLLFHCAAEFFSIFVALAIFVVAWNTRAWASNRYLLFLGIAYLFVAFVDVSHALAYKGMGVFPTHGATEATQLWILARYIEAFSLMAAPLFITRRMRVAPLFIVYAAVSGFGLLAIWRLGIFPDCFIEGQGLTPFKVASEYVIIGLLAGAIAHLLRYREKIEPRIMTLLVAAMAVTIVEEMAFTLYTDVYGVSNVVGHLLKAASFYLIYRAIVVTSLASPYQLLFRDLAGARRDIQHEQDMARRYLDIAGVMLVALDTTGRVSLLNKRATEVLGYTTAEAIGKDWFETFRPESRRENARRAFQLLLAGDTEAARREEFSETTVVTRSGQERTIAWHDTAVHDSSGVSVGTLSSGEDITERLGAEAALRESEQKFRSLFENSPDPVYMNATDGSGVVANRAWLDLFGYSAEELPGLKSTDIYADPRDREKFLHAIEGKDVLRDDEVRFKKKNGAVMDCIRTVVALKDPGGRTVAYQGIIRDITQQKQAARTLRESEQKYRSLFEQSMDAICLVSPGGHLIEANRAYLNLFGFEEEEIAGINVEHQYVDPEGRMSFLEWMTSHDALVDEEVQLYRKDRTTMDCLHSAVTRRAEDGSVIGYQSVIRDVTQQKQAARTLRESEQKYRSLFEQSMDAIALASPDGKLLEANQAYLDLFGYSEDMIDAVNVRSQYVDPEGREKFLRRMETGDTLIDDEVQLRKKDGSVMDCVRTVVTRRNRDGSVMGYQNVIRDITERKRAETLLREYAAHLERIREEERTGIARELHDQLGQALTALKMDLSSVYDRFAKKQVVDPEKISTMIRLVDVTTDEVRRISSELRPGVLDDLGFVAAMEWQLQQFEERTGIRCELTAPDSPDLGRDRSTALYRIFQELLTNVGRHAAAKTVRVAFERDDSSYVLTVADDGRGMAEGAANRASSLGFVGIRERLAPFGGSLTVAGAPGQGTRVTIAVPVDRRAPGSKHSDRRQG